MDDKEKPQIRPLGVGLTAEDVPTSIAAMSISMPRRRFAKREGRAPAFWEISLDGAICRTREGRIGAPGTVKEKEKAHRSPEAAIESYVTSISAKLWSGYAEEVAPGSPSPAMPIVGPADLATQRAKVRALVDAASLSRHADAIDASLKVAIGLRLRRVDEVDLPIGGSRFGGRPDLPPGTPWPSHLEKKGRDNPERSRPLDFVAQLRLEEIAPFDEARLLPRTGLVSFFVLGDFDSQSEHEPDYLSICKVLHHRGATLRSLARTSPPAGAGRTWRGKRVTDPYVAHAIEPLPIVTLPPSDSRTFKKLRLNEDEGQRFHDGVREPFGRWRSARFPGRRGSHLLGYRDRDDDREPKELLLLQCETDYSAQMLWGDADFLYFWGSPDALVAGRFDEVTSSYAD